MQNIYKKRKNYTRVIIAGIVVALLIVGAQKLYGVYQDNMAYVENLSDQKAHAEFIELMREDVAYEKRALINDLGSKCETKGIAENKKDGAIILDTNNQIAIGFLMFQRETIIDVKERLLGEKITWAGASMLAMDRERATKLAEYLIFEKGQINKWYNCNVRLGLSARIKEIKLREARYNLETVDGYYNNI